MSKISRRGLLAIGAASAVAGAGVAGSEVANAGGTAIERLHRKLAQQTRNAEQHLETLYAASDRFEAIRPRVPDEIRVANVMSAYPVGPQLVRDGKDADGNEFLWVAAIGWEVALPNYWNEASRTEAEAKLMIAKRYDRDVKSARISAGEVEADASSTDSLRVKWDTEEQILTMQATSHADAHIQLSVLHSSHQGCEYPVEVVERVIASVLRVLT